MFTTHVFGTTESPVNPERIVTTSDQNGLLPLMELGLLPVGSSGLERDPLGHDLVVTGVNG